MSVLLIFQEPNHSKEPKKKNPPPQSLYEYHTRKKNTINLTSQTRLKKSYNKISKLHLSIIF